MLEREPIARVTRQFSLAPGYVRGLEMLAGKYPHSELDCEEYRDEANVGWMRAIVMVRRTSSLRPVISRFILSPTGRVWREPDYWNPSEQLRSPVARGLELVRDADYDTRKEG
jgi:hypothetical protein